jgi:ubiquinone/menaquinone biosynthesis C-methylase UbiE
MITEKADYGIDAPNVVRNLFLFSLILFIGSIFAFRVQSPLWFWMAFLYTFPVSLALLGTGCWMLYGIKVVKPKMAVKLLQKLRLQGNEKILDLGCGRGLLLCEAAKHLPQGEAHGIDLWYRKDQSGNKPEITLENARREGVKEKVSIHTGDVQALPFPDATFDVIVSSLCLHNIKDRKGRQQALFEGLRVLRPGGRFAIIDIQHAKEYAEFLKSQGVSVECSKPNYSYCPPLITVEGKKPDAK